MEAVNSPGYIPLPEKGTLTVLDAINQAGGFKNNAKTNEIAIYRPVKGGLKAIQVSIIKGVPSKNEPLQDKDIVYVPQGKEKQGFLSKLPMAVAIASGVGNLIP
jgi:protein involved in polysaccharide export with SLBB domain